MGKGAAYGILSLGCIQVSLSASYHCFLWYILSMGPIVCVFTVILLICDVAINGFSKVFKALRILNACKFTLISSFFSEKIG